jgi:hypothetical protein
MGDRLDPRRAFEFVKANRASYPVATMCRVLDVSTSGYYAWLKRTLSERSRINAALTERIRWAHLRSRGTCGTPRIHAELTDEGVRVRGPQAGGAPDACCRLAGRQPPQAPPHHDPAASGTARAGPGEAELRRYRGEPSVGS